MSNSMKLLAMSGRATQDGQVMVESSDKMWSTGEGNGKALQYSCLENPMNSLKRQEDRTVKDELPRSVGTQYATGDQWRNNSRKTSHWNFSVGKFHGLVYMKKIHDSSASFNTCNHPFLLRTFFRFSYYLPFLEFAVPLACRSS